MPCLSSRAARHRAGVSLVELMLGLAIFSTAVLMILGIFPTSARSIQQARTVLLGTHVANVVLEQYTRALPFDQVVNRTSGANDPITGVSNPAIPLVSNVNGSQRVVTFHWQIAVTSVTSDLKGVRCQVSWVDTEQASSVCFVRCVNLETMVVNI